MSITKIKQESLRVQVYSALKEKIIQGYWREGEKLPSEQELCGLFGVSRITVRTALQQLEILGIVETKHGGGTFVQQFSVSRNMKTIHPLIQIQGNQDLITIMEYRKIIEKGTIGLTIGKIVPADIAFLEQTYTTMTDETRDMEKYIQADFDFHNKLAQISQNSMIINVHELIHEILYTAIEDIVYLVGRGIGPFYHRKIIDALKQGDKAICETLMEEHIEKNIQVLREAVNSE